MLPELRCHTTTTVEAAKFFDNGPAIRRRALGNSLLLIRELSQPIVVEGQGTPQVIQVRRRRCK